MREKHLSFSQVIDIFGFRVLVADMPTCYLALGVLHELYKPIPGKFKDYIAIPKANGYQSLHTDAVRPVRHAGRGRRSAPHDMHRVAEAGVAAHWLYKTTATSTSPSCSSETHQLAADAARDPVASRGDSAGVPRARQGRPVPRRGLRVHAEGQDPGAAARRDRRRLRLRACTPTSATTASPRSINDELVPLRTELKNGDHVEIITSPTARPNPSWLTFVATGKARSHIRHFLKSLQQKESAALGERLLNQALATLKVEPESITWDRWEALAKEYGAKTPARDPGRHRPRQAAVVRRRAGADARAGQGRRRRAPPTAPARSRRR